MHRKTKKKNEKSEPQIECSWFVQDKFVGFLFVRFLFVCFLGRNIFVFLICLPRKWPSVCDEFRQKRKKRKKNEKLPMPNGQTNFSDKKKTNLSYITQIRRKYGNLVGNMKNFRALKGENWGICRKFPQCKQSWEKVYGKWVRLDNGPLRAQCGLGELEVKISVIR